MINFLIHPFKRVLCVQKNRLIETVPFNTQNILVEREQNESLITPQIAMYVLTVRACVCVCEEKHDMR